MPDFIRRLCITTLIAAVFVGLILCGNDWRAGLTFAVAVVWSLLLVVSWALLTVWLLGNPPGKGLRIALLVSAKILVVYVGGFLLLCWASPLTKAQALSVIAGLSLVFAVALLKAIGAQLTGRDLLQMPRKPESESDAEDDK